MPRMSNSNSTNENQGQSNSFKGLRMKDRKDTHGQRLCTWNPLALGGDDKHVYWFSISVFPFSP